MSEAHGGKLKRNICNLSDYPVPSEVKALSTYKKDHIGDSLEYACKFWTKHLLEIPSSSPHAEEVEKVIIKFFKAHLLHWIEVLAITGDLGIGVHAMNDVQQWCNLVSGMQFVFQNLSSWFCRWESYQSGQMMANIFYSSTLTQFTTLPPIPIILLSYFLLPFLGFTRTTMQRLHLWCVSAQFLWFEISTFDKVSIPTVTHFPGNRGSPPSPFLLFPSSHTPEDKMDKMDFEVRLIV